MYNQSIMMKKIVFTFLLLLSSAVYAVDNPLGAGDMLRITVYGNPDLTTETRVTSAGVINFPLIGEVNVSNTAVPEAAKLIAKSLEGMGFLRRPQVNIVVTQFSSLQVSILGQVARPGKYPVSTAARTVIDFLALAGGVTPNGSDIVTLMTTSQENPQRYEIDINNVFKTGDTSRNVELSAGDIIYVERAPRFYIYGEVNRSGAYRLEHGMTVSQALATGGGVSARGTEKGVRIKRKNTEGELITIPVDASTVIMVDDVVYVKESLF